MTEPSAVWFLDVDGVLNAFPWLALQAGGAAPEPAWPDMEVGSCKSHASQTVAYSITFSPTLMARIRELHESGRVEVRWLTTWSSGANYELRHLLGLSEFQLAGPHPTRREMHKFDESGIWWKRAVALGAIKALSPETKVVWTDDHLVGFPSLRKGLSKDGVLTIAPDEQLGLTPADLDRIVSYLETGDA